MGAGARGGGTGRADGRLSAVGDDPELTLEAVERRRRRLFASASAAALGAAGIATLVLVVGDVGLPAWTGWALLAATAVLVIDAAVSVRTLDELTHEIVRQRTRAAELAHTVEDLTALHDLARRVNAALLPEEVYDVVLTGAVELLGAVGGTLWLRVGEQLTVAASAGPEAPEVGRTVELGADPSVVVVTLGVDLTEEDPPRLGVPLTVGARHVGVLEVARDAGEAPFSSREALVLRLFAEEATTAFVNANRYDAERRRVEQLGRHAERRASAVADTVHDLRAPLSGLLGFAVLLRERHDRMDDHQRREATEAIEHEVERLAELIDTVFEAASAEERATTHRATVDVGALVHDVCRTLQAGAQPDGGIEVVAAGATTALADPGALRRVVVNLVANAIEHGGGRVQLRVGQRSGELWLHVADRGPGMTSAQVESAFERRARDGDDPRGRGLPIAAGLVRAMGGRISVRSELGVGTVFTVRLPVPEADAAAG